MKKFLISIVAILSFFLVVIGVLTILNYVPKTFTKSKISSKWLASNNKNRPLVIPHGGAKETYPENTMYAFEKTSNYDAFEIDLCLTKDDVLLTHHDLHLGLMANQKDKLVRKHTYPEIIDLIKNNNFPHVRNFNGSSKEETYDHLTNDEILSKQIIPVNIEKVFEKFPNKLYILEIKDFIKDDAKKSIDILVSLINKYNLKENVLVASFNDYAIKEFNKVTKDEIPTMAATMDVAKFAILSKLGLDFFFSSKVDCLSLPYREKLGGKTLDKLLSYPSFIRNILSIKEKKSNNTYEYYSNFHSERIIKDAHRKKLSVIYWTVNNESEMKELIEKGADGIITDNPKLLVEVLKKIK